MDMSQIKKLREETGAGMLDCKKALESASGNYELALELLHNATKKIDGNTRVFSKGLCSVVIHLNQAILFEVNAETDFVSKNEHFIKLIQELGMHLIQSSVTNVIDAKKLVIGDITVEQKIQQTISIIKENAQLRRFYRILKDDDQSFGSYIHLGGKVVTLVILDKNNPEIANTLALQVAANSPKYKDPKTMDENTMEYERYLYENEQESFDETQFIQHINDMCLLTQQYIKNPEIQVANLLEENSLKVIDFYRFELGQGIENKLNCKIDVSCNSMPSEINRSE